MESNREEAQRCLRLAEKFLQQGDKDKAAKFGLKAKKLYPSDEAEDFLEKVASFSGKSNLNQDNNHTDHNHTQMNGDSKPSETTTNNEYSSDEVEAVKRVRNETDYYKIVGVTKDHSESDLKKAYRKNALRLHPDKNKVPGASEAFKKFSNAYVVLSDPEKRRQYDLYGPDQPSNSRSRRHHEHEAHGFEGDMTAEEIFNMFFGGTGFPSQSVYVRRGRNTAHFHRHFHNTHHHADTTVREPSGFAALIQLMPILIVIFLSVVSSLLVSDPLYSLQATTKFHVRRTTSNLHIPYFVKDSFKGDFSGSLRKLEASIEEEYLNSLRQACYREKSYKENLLWQARYSGNSNLLNRAHNYATPSCDQLERIYTY